MISLYMIATVL